MTRERIVGRADIRAFVDDDACRIETIEVDPDAPREPDRSSRML